MDRLGVVGIGWQRGGPDLLARFTLPRDERAAQLRHLAETAQVEELVYLATCNRVEIAFATDATTPVSDVRARIFEALSRRPPQPGEAERLWRAWAGEGAAEHLYLVTAGLDSARVGETDIAGQVRDALEASRALGLVGPRLGQVLDGALKVAGRIHQLTGVGVGRTSLAEVALDAVRAQLREVEGDVALVGVSPMTQRCAKALSEEGGRLIIANRSEGRALKLAKKVGGRGMSLPDFTDTPPSVVALICATASPAPVVSREALAALKRRSPDHRGPLIVDMAVPPDVSPDAARAEGLRRLDMDAIIAHAEANRTERLQEMAEARLLVDEGLTELRRQMCDRLLAPLITQMRQRSLNEANTRLERLLRRDLADLNEAQAEAVRRWTRTLVKRMIHPPTVGLRALAFEAGPEAVEAFLTGADAELAKSFGDIAQQAAQLGQAEEDT